MKSIISLRALVRVSLVCAAACAALPVAHALDVTVNPGGNIQAALDTVGSAGGGTVYLNYGTYTVSGTLKFPDNTRLKGVTTRPIINFTGTANQPVMASKRIVDNSAAYTDLTADFLSINGGLTDANITAGTYLDRVGINFSDMSKGVFSTRGWIYNCNITRAAMGVIIGRVNDGILQGSNLTVCGSTATVGFHNIYISNVNPLKVRTVNSSNCRTGMGLKITDFYGDRTETSQLVEWCVLNSNYDRGMAVYDITPLIVRNNTANNNGKSGINLLRCGTVSMTDNTATGNLYQVDVAYDIWLNACTAVTQSGNTYGSKRGF